jgi:hypothetical protein
MEMDIFNIIIKDIMKFLIMENYYWMIILSKNKIWKKRNYNKFKCKYEWYFML